METQPLSASEPLSPRACVLIFNDQQQIMLIHRVKNGSDYWVVPGGSIEAGETPVSAAIREAREELSLTVEKLILCFEQQNRQRHEYYFFTNHYHGTAALGQGPEQLRQHASNLYQPAWVKVTELADINLQPTSTKARILAQQHLWSAQLKPLSGA